MKIKGLYQKNGIWYFQPPMKKGHRPPAVSLRTKDRAEALRHYEHLSRQDMAARKSGRVLVEASRYVSEKSARGRHTPKTAANTLHILGQLARWQCPGEHGRMVADLTPDMLQRYASDLGTRLSPTSIRSKFGSIRGFCSWLVAQGFLDKNPCLGLELPRLVATRRDRYCSREERDLLLSRCDRDDLALVLHLGFLAGLRAGEIVAARRDWVDVPAGVLHVRPTSDFVPKGKHARTIRMGSRLTEFLRMGDDMATTYKHYVGFSRDNSHASSVD